MRDKVEQLQADIEQGVAELVEGEDWQRWLRVAARFPRYRGGAAGYSNSPNRQQGVLSLPGAGQALGGFLVP